MQRLKGLIAAPFTPLDNKGELALEKIDTLVQLYENNGVNGVFVAGSTGEGVSLSHEEKKVLLTYWAKAKGKRIKALFMLGGTCLKELQELAILAQQHRLDGISILCPYYFKPASVTQLVAFCKEVADAAPKLSFYYYHIPALTGGHFSMLEFLKEADGLIPNLTGIKYTHPDLFDLQACAHFQDKKYNILWGVDEALLSGLAAGADGGIGSTYNYAAPLYNQVIEAFEQGNMEQAKQLQYKAVEMVQLLIKYGGTGAGKAFMKLIGVDCGWFRLPVTSPSTVEVQALQKELEDIGFFEYCSQIKTKLAII